MSHSPLALIGLAYGEHGWQVERVGMEYFHSSGNIVLARCFTRNRSNRPRKFQITLTSPSPAVSELSCPLTVVHSPVYFRVPVLKRRNGNLRCKAWWQAHMPVMLKQFAANVFAASNLAAIPSRAWLRAQQVPLQRRSFWQSPLQMLLSRVAEQRPRWSILLTLLPLSSIF